MDPRRLLAMYDIPAPDIDSYVAELDNRRRRRRARLGQIRRRLTFGRARSIQVTSPQRLART